MIKWEHKDAMTKKNEKLSRKSTFVQYLTKNVSHYESIVLKSMGHPGSEYQHHTLTLCTRIKGKVH